MGLIDHDPFYEAVQDAQDRVGRKMIIVSTPAFLPDAKTPVNGFDRKKAAKILDLQVERGAAICMPHQSTTDMMVDRCTRKLRKMDVLFKMMRERKLIPGLSTHLPETIVYADEAGADVETYISIFNLMGFLMPIEVDWVASAIQKARKPVMTIKPMAAGQLRPLQALTFVWNAIRDKDMVTIRVMTPDEAAENIELSLSILERRTAKVRLQETRSKASVKAADQKLRS